MPLLTHCGARPVSYGELDQMGAPTPTETWFPIPHSQVLSKGLETLQGAGFSIESMQLAVSNGDARFFGTLELSSQIVNGVIAHGS